ncbi:MAG TPA: penicillin-binding transpeptidase domain-containing protein, partial [Elusimicrobiales bacterium]|nr:penicillin-binding transpeptidase domain-containing protein [Elusimicrobiales bacterium]
PASLLDDSPLNIPIGNNIFSPQNYDKQFHGLIPACIALASSVNVPAVKTLMLVGIEPFLDKLAQAGFERLNSADFYGPSLALGSADVTLWELVNAYRMLANGGVWTPMHLTSAKNNRESRRVFSKEAVFLVSDILSDRENRSATFGLESVLATRYWTAVKTGTSKDMRDNWCIGYSDAYTVGVWMGNFSGQPMWDVSGMSGAAPAWVEIMNWLHHNRTSKSPVPPPGVIKTTAGSDKAGWFLKGTEPARPAQLSEHHTAKINYPPEGSFFGLDPDIPPSQQILTFEASVQDTNLCWVLDQKNLGNAEKQVDWILQPGKHTLSLQDQSNNVLDTVHFEVRGTLSQTDPEITTDN